MKKHTASQIKNIPRQGLAAIIGLVAIAAVMLQFYVSITGDLENAKSAAGAVWRVLGYYTILTNMLLGLTMTAVAFKVLDVTKHRGASFISFNTLHILIVGAVYHLILKPAMPAKHGLDWIADFGFHTFTPVCTLIFWIFFVSKSKLRYRDSWRWMIYPLIYTIYVHLRAVFDNWYPYPFMDVQKIGLIQVVEDALILGFAFWLLGLGLIAFGRYQSLEKPIDTN